MSIFQNLSISGSALTANRLRMDVISSNMANAETTRSELVNGEWQPYRRKVVSLQSNGGPSFSSLLQNEMSKGSAGGVKVKSITEDQSPFKLVYNPTHPDANEDGYVQLPNVDPLKEMTDLIGATRSYEANITVLNANKNLLLKALEIGK
ncbi:flagellar basal body rod protein FlgC [Priestia flexa]|nr:MULTISPECIES: flagellar basal body rod protein FlgC [Bacillaceae]AQX54043.1 flagellar basal body rod protein FlgC [Priestia flexa]KZB93275.1 flagellar basal body rod protein FlgC [Bacillus sp. VT 712]MBY6084798.1 flagellar basal body rod protein FlgC [Priestia flexa]MCG7312193.1 flagellar basal body rod protein FlgC [Priestia flexa]MCM3065570.1 flagellar basal body rod protein FlgC [Priestia flexa]